MGSSPQPREEAAFPPQQTQRSSGPLPVRRLGNSAVPQGLFSRKQQRRAGRVHPGSAGRELRSPRFAFPGHGISAKIQIGKDGASLHDYRQRPQLSSRMRAEKCCFLLSRLERARRRPPGSAFSPSHQAAHGGPCGRRHPSPGTESPVQVQRGGPPSPPAPISPPPPPRARGRGVAV
ncbi:unnamed protein product [Rangifer tarandus platyrhynchus]|uniref:Uncharacterized protein n=1 Tax=Rangifer tarandus platyrhynchus TaxID=3082113 RepID=A0AC60A4I2_RANTA